MNLFSTRLSFASAWASVAAATSAGAVLSLAAPAHAFLPAYTTINPTGGNYTTANPSSFGFFFDTRTNVLIDALGFSYRNTWVSGSPSYTVTLWSFTHGGQAPGDFLQLASRTFDSTSVYTLKDGYWWNSITPIVLPRTSYPVDPGNLKGYVIAAIGDFSGAPGTVQFEGTTEVGSAVIVDDRFDLGGNGFNDSDQPALPTGFYPIPIADGNIGINGYFNPNLSYVPGPLPILGTATAFGMARRMRRRVKAAQGS